MLTILSHQSSSLPPELTYKPRIPKLRVRNRLPDVPPISEHPAYRQAPQTPEISVEPQAVAGANPPPARPGLSSVTSPGSSRVPSSESGAHNVPTKPKRSGVLGFLLLKEPSANAWEQFVAEEKKKAAAKEGKNPPYTNITSKALPPTVPKVNSKWDGLPDVARSRSTSNATRTSTTGSSRAPTQATRQSSGSGRPGSGDKRGNTASSGSYSKSSSRPSTGEEQASSSSKQTTPVGTPKTVKFSNTSDSPVTTPKAIPEYSLFFPPSLPPIPSLDGAADERPTSKENRMSNNSSSNSDSPEIPSTPPDEYSLGNIYQDSPQLRHKPAFHRPSRSLEGPQWPLPLDSNEIIIQTGSDMLGPPINPTSAPRAVSPPAQGGLEEDPPQSPRQRLYIRDTSPEPTKDTTPPASPVRVFSRPFHSPQSSVSAASSEPNSMSIPPSLFEQPRKQPVLIPPRLRPGQVVTKDSDLATIPESDTASILYKAPTDTFQETSYYDDGEDYDDDQWGDHADQVSIAESQASEMSAQWYQTPQERLGLGSHITWNSSGNIPPWQLSAKTSMEEEMLRMRAQAEEAEDGRRTPTQEQMARKEEKKAKRSSLKDVFKR